MYLFILNSTLHSKCILNNALFFFFYYDYDLTDANNWISSERSAVYSLLSSYSWLQPHGESQANFILCKVLNFPAFLLAGWLREKGVLLRYYSNPRLMHYVRFSIGRPEETKALKAALDLIDEDPSKLVTQFISKTEGLLWDMDGL